MNETSPSVSVVICTYNRADTLKRAIDSVLSQETEGVPIELVVIDDGSTDNTQAVIEDARQRAPFQIRSKQQAQKSGIAAARNEGISHSQGKFVLFFDDDQLADPNWVRDMHTVAVSRHAELVGGPRRLDLPEEKLRSLGPVCRGMLGENLYEGGPSTLTGKELPTTGNLLLARTLVDKVGPFDVKLSSGEDAEFIGRARNAGVDIWTAPTAMVAHIIPPYRATMPYFKWSSLRWGAQFATIDHKRHGLSKTIINAKLRKAQALLVHLPKLWLAKARGDEAAASDLQCLLWRADGYVRKTWQLVFPRLCAQEKFFHYLDFRRERELFPQDGSA